MSQLAQVAAEISKAMNETTRTGSVRSRLATLSAEVSENIRRHTSAVDRAAEWQRVHSYIADVLKDTHVLYAKLARLEGDFAGEELARLERISEAVLTLGNELSAFSKAFYEGKYEMAQSEFAYGEESSGDSGKGGQQSPAPSPEAPIVPPTDAEIEQATQEGEQGGEGQQAQQEPEEA